MSGVRQTMGLRKCYRIFPKFSVKVQIEYSTSDIFNLRRLPSRMCLALIPADRTEMLSRGARLTRSVSEEMGCGPRLQLGTPLTMAYSETRRHGGIVGELGLFERGTPNMTGESTRRRFLEVTGSSVGMAGLAGPFVLGPTPQGAASTALEAPARPKIAALATVYHYLSHAYHIVGRFIDGFPVHDGRGLHVPPFEIASLFVEQTPALTDLGLAKARQHGIRVSPIDRRCAHAWHRQARRRRRPVDRRAR